MINKIIKLIDQWKLPSNLLAKVWSEPEKTVSDLKRFAMAEEPSMNHLDWRIIDLFVHEMDRTEDSCLRDVFNKPMLEIESFRKKLTSVGVRASDAQGSLEKWMTILDRFHIHCTSPKKEPTQAKPVINQKTETPAPIEAESINSQRSKAPAHSYDYPAPDIREVKPARLKPAPAEEKQSPVEPEELVIAEPQEGIGPYRPANINNSFHSGFMYYPIQTIIGKRTEGKDGEKVAEKQETVVIRSDRTLQKIVKSDRLMEGDAGQDVYRLTDGTLIHSIPSPNTHGTWQWSYIEKFINGEDVSVNLADAIKLIRKHLMSRIWLPYEDDYTLLAVTAVVTYVQSIFESVPLILLMGPAGSGKSELGMAMTEVSANATMIGQVSAPTMMRLIDESGGLCVIDDLESIGVSNSKVGKQKFSEIAQVLKVSYKKSTATRMVTNPSTRRTQVMNFFGVKIVNNTTGVDDILGSRMLHVHTKHIDKGCLEDFQNREGVDEDVIEDVRNRLHNWAYSNVDLVNKVYQEVSMRQSDRATEISEPLLTIARLAEDPEISSSLNDALMLQKQRKNRDRSPEDVLSEVVERLVNAGYEEVAVTHVVLELRRELDPGYEIDYHKDMPGWSRQEWVGRKLREMGVVDTPSSSRKRIKGKNLRILGLKKRFIQDVLGRSGQERAGQRKYNDFCGDCSECPFARHSCEIRAA